MIESGQEGVLLTELEGGILSELHHRGRQTAFKVRRSFADSPSLEWRGSAGSVYGAIRKLERAGLIAAEEKGDRRASRLLSVTAAGERAMLAWACDPSRATSVGVDPFRMRAGIWSGLGDGERQQALKGVRDALVASITFLESFSRRNDAIERHSVALALAVQRARLDWLDGFAVAQDGRNRSGVPDA
jgi:DNA-binding PadR family transcriptional regulator